MANDDTYKKCKDCQSNDCVTCEFSAPRELECKNRVCVCCYCGEVNDHKYYKKIEQKQNIDENNVRLTIDLVAVDDTGNFCNDCYFHGYDKCYQPDDMGCNPERRKDGRSIVWKLKED